MSTIPVSLTEKQFDAYVHPYWWRCLKGRSCTMSSNTPALTQRCVCWQTASHGGRSLGIIRQLAPRWDRVLCSSSQRSTFSQSS
jgi:hypothetical protein